MIRSKPAAGRGPCALRGAASPAWRGFPLCVAMVALLWFCSTQKCDAGTGPALPWSNARQLVLVTSPNWTASSATLRTFTRTRHGWQSAGGAIPVAIGRAGAAWGIGMHPQQPGALKQEGDGRSPAGVFTLGTAFGYAASVPTKMRYAALSIDDYCIDVPSSAPYNRIVNARDVGAAAVAGSTEPMRRDLHIDGDQLYKLGFVIEHNPRGTTGAGSCIFAHLWQSAATPTTGCTAMGEQAMRVLLRWLRPQEHPIFVLLPRAEYTRLRSAWDLPELAAP